MPAACRRRVLLAGVASALALRGGFIPADWSTAGLIRALRLNDILISARRSMRVPGPIACDLDHPEWLICAHTGSQLFAWISKIFGDL